MPGDATFNKEGDGQKLLAPAVRSSITILIHECFSYHAISEIRDHTTHTGSYFDRSMTFNAFMPQIL